MSPESFSSNLEHEKVAPKQQASLEEIQKVEKDIEYSKHLTKVNDVLNVLDLPDDKEESYRKTFEKQDPQTLKELAKKSKKEILTFIFENNDKDISNKIEDNQKEAINVEQVKAEETEKR